MTASLTNVYGGGDSGMVRIDILKDWLDDNAVSQRQNVTVEVVKINTAKTGDDRIVHVSPSDPENHPYTPVTVLSAKNKWTDSIWIYESDFKDGDLSSWGIIETIGDESRVGVFASPSFYGKGDKEAIAYVAPSATSSEYPGYRAVIADRNGNNVLGSTNYKITNTRIGKQRLIVDKTWLDGRNAGKTRGYGYKLSLFKLNPANGEEEATGISHILLATGSDYNEPLMHVVLDQDKRITEDPYLDLYDALGKQIVYSVREYISKDSSALTDPEHAEWTEISETETALDTRTGYVMDKKTEDAVYTSESYPGNSVPLYTRSQTFKVTNKLDGMRREGVKFYKIWHDQDNAVMRPDVRYDL